MGGPWEDYQDTKAESGPWDDYAQTPEEHPLSGDTPAARMKAMNPPEVSDGTPEWAKKHPNLYAGIRTAKDFIDPTIEGAALVGGGIVGSGAGPAGSVVGAGLGYAGGKRLSKSTNVMLGFEQPETAAGAFKQAGKDVVEGVAIEAGGQVLGKVAPPVSKYVGEKAQSGARGIYKSAAKFPTTLSHADRTKLAETALREKILPTEKGLGKLAQTQRDILGAVNKAVEDVSSKGGKIETNKVLKQLDYAYDKARLSDDPIGYTKVIDDISDKFKAHGDTISVSDAHQIKKNIYKLLPSKAYEPTFAASERVSITGRKGIGRGLKEGVEQAVPGVKEANARAKELIDLSEVLNKTVNRIENSNLISLNTDLAAVVGAQLSGAGGAATLGAARGVLGLPKVKSRIAMALYKSGGQLKNIAEVFGETPAGQQMINSFKDSKTQAILKSNIADKDKARFLTKEFLKQDGFKALPADTQGVYGPGGQFVINRAPKVIRKPAPETKYYKKIDDAVLIYDPAKDNYFTLPNNINQINKARQVDILELAKEAVSRPSEPTSKTSSLLEAAAKSQRTKTWPDK